MKNVSFGSNGRADSKRRHRNQGDSYRKDAVHTAGRILENLKTVEI